MPKNFRLAEYAGRGTTRVRTRFPRPRYRPMRTKRAWPRPTEVTTTKRRKLMDDYSGELSYMKWKTGRYMRRKSARFQRKLVAGTSKRIHNIHAMYSSFGGTNGLNVLANLYTGGIYTPPMIMYDVTATPNISKIGGIATSYTSAQCGYYATFNGALSTSTIEWRTYGDAMVSDKTPAVAGYYDNVPGENSILRSINAKLMLYAPTTLPTKWVIQLVQFKDQRLLPFVNSVAGAPGLDNVGSWQATGTSLGTQSDPFAIGFWHDYVHSFTKSPIVPHSSQYSRYVNVIASKTIIMNPKDSTEPTNTKYKQLDFFRWVNRRCNYQWNDENAPNPTADSAVPQNEGFNRLTVHPKARMFLIIRALAGYRTDSYNATVHPSYDIVLRTTHEDLS